MNEAEVTVADGGSSEVEPRAHNPQVGGSKPSPATTLSPASIAHLHAVLHGALDQAMRWNLIARNPASAVKAPRAKRRPMTVYTPDEARALLQAVEGDDLEALYVLALMTGARQGELLALTWRDVEPGWLNIRGTKSEAATRRVALSALAERALRRHRLRMAERLLRFRGRPDGDTLVFLTELGEAYNGSHVTERAFKPLLRRAGLREIRFHDLRHAFAFVPAQHRHPDQRGVGDAWPLDACGDAGHLRSPAAG